MKPDGWGGEKTRKALDQYLPPLSLQVSSLSGASRTDWRGFKSLDASRLAAILPDTAKPLASSFVSRAREFGLNALFLAAISQHETGAWTSNVFRTKNNAMGISNAKGAVACSSYDDSIRRAAYSLGRPGGYYSKAKTLADVAKIYAPPGAANDPTNVNGYWPGLVSKYWSQMEAKIGA